MPLFFKTFFAVILVFVLSGCSGTEHRALADIARDYFQVYAKRSDFERFMAFYDDNARFNDIIYGERLKNKTEIVRFLDWNRGEFAVNQGSRILTVTDQLTAGNRVITRGYFHRFRYNGQLMGPWLFVIVLEFNGDNKIIKQTDWINYTPRKDFTGGLDMNQQLLEKPL